MSKQIDIVFAAQKDAKTNNPEPADIYEVGNCGHDHSAASIARWNCEGFGRRQKSEFALKDYKETENFFVVDVEEIPESSKRKRGASFDAFSEVDL